MATPADVVLGPRWSEIAVRTTSSTAATLDLDTLGPQTASAVVQSVGARKCYVRICAVTTDVAVVFAASSADADDVVYPSSGSAGVNATSGCVPIFASSYQDFTVPADMPFLGYVTASAAGILVIFISSRPF